MATRSVLHMNKLDEFKKWLVSEGWNIEPVKGDYEVLRARKASRKIPLVVYQRNRAKEHLSVLDKDMGVIGAFLRDSKKCHE